MDIKQTYRAAALLAVLLLLGFAARAQQFRTHAVKEGETLYSIARQYQVSTGDLLRYNKEIGDGTALRPNTILVIPAADATGARKAPGIEAQDTTGLNKPIGFRTHRVKKKETLFSITREYGISEKDLKRYNPDLYSSPLQKGMVLRVPQYAPGREPGEAAGDDWITYKVQPRETRWSIASKFGISMDSLLNLNPELPRSTMPSCRLPRSMISGLSRMISSREMPNSWLRLKSVFLGGTV